MLCSNPFVKKATGIEKGKTDGTPFPCGQCFHCRLNQARIWQTRLLLEAQTSYDSAFLTLTYDDDNIPQGNNLVKSDLQKFLKRYRKLFQPQKIRYFAIGEYGDETWRPHYHLAIFSEQLLERCYRPCADMRKRDLCTKDCYLAKAWKFGNVEISQTLGKENAGYITGYIKKKATKEYREGLGNRQPEFATMSKQKGGLGNEAIRRIAEKFKSHLESVGTDSRVIRQINLGGKPVPIGGYLSTIFSDHLGISRAQRSVEYYEYALDLQERYLQDGVILTNLLDDTKSKRHSRETRSKLFNKRKTL